MKSRTADCRRRPASNIGHVRFEEGELMQDIVFRFRRPSGFNHREPSVAMTEALRRLSEAAEMQPLLANARQSGISVAIEVFLSRGGEPILIHFGKEEL